MYLKWCGKYFKDYCLSDVSTVQYQWHIVSHHFYFAYFSCKVSYWFVLRNKSYLPFLIWTEFLLVAQWKWKLSIVFIIKWDYLLLLWWIKKFCDHWDLLCQPCFQTGYGTEKMYQRMNVLFKVLLMKWNFVCVHYEQNMTCIYHNTWYLTSNNRKLL